jgi:DNA-binding MarR family transcriptional regulator
MKGIEVMKLVELVKRFDVLFFKRRILFQKLAADAGLYFGQLPILEYIVKHNGCSQVEIADTLNLSPASVAISTKRLQKAGMIEKTVDDANLRSKKLTITEKGLEMSKKCRELFDTLDKIVFSGFNESELAQFKDYLDRLIANISKGQDKDKYLDFFEILAMKNQMHNNKFCSKEGESK